MVRNNALVFSFPLLLMVRYKTLVKAEFSSEMLSSYLSLSIKQPDQTSVKHNKPSSFSGPIFPLSLFIHPTPRSSRGFNVNAEELELEMPGFSSHVTYDGDWSRVLVSNFFSMGSPCRKRSHAIKRPPWVSIQRVACYPAVMMVWR